MVFLKNISTTVQTHNMSNLTSILAFVHRGISTIMLKTVLSELANNGTSWKGDTSPFGPPTKSTQNSYTTNGNV